MWLFLGQSFTATAYAWPEQFFRFERWILNADTVVLVMCDV
jgi:hypothetical protein